MGHRKAQLVGPPALPRGRRPFSSPRQFCPSRPACHPRLRRQPWCLTVPPHYHLLSTSSMSGSGHPDDHLILRWVTRHNWSGHRLPFSYLASGLPFSSPQQFCPSRSACHPQLRQHPWCLTAPSPVVGPLVNLLYIRQRSPPPPLPLPPPDSMIATALLFGAPPPTNPTPRQEKI
jgi:hypothetical protein